MIRLVGILILISLPFNSISQYLKKTEDSACHPIFNKTGDSVIDFSILNQLRGKQIIGIGEAAHRCKTFYKMECALSKAIVDSLHATRVFLEVSYFTNSFFQRRERMNAKSIASWGDFIQCMNFDQVTTIGMNPGFLEDNLDKLTNCLDSIAPSLSDTIRDLFSMQDSFYSSYFWYKITKEELDTFKTKIASLQPRFKNLKDNPYPEASYFLIKDVEYLYIVRTQGYGHRDSVMAQIISDFMDPVNPNIVLAHNGHLIYWNTDVIPLSLGEYLKQRFMDKAFIIGSDFKEGEFRANVKNEETSTYEMKIVSIKPWKRSIWKRTDATEPFYCLRSSLPDKQYKTYLPGSAFFGRSNKVNYRKNYDATIFFPKIEAAEMTLN